MIPKKIKYNLYYDYLGGVYHAKINAVSQESKEKQT